MCYCKEVPFCQNCIGTHLAEEVDVPHQTVVMKSTEMMEIMKAGKSQLNQARAQIIQEQQEGLRRKTFALTRISQEIDLLNDFESHSIDLIEAKTSNLVAILLQSRKLLTQQVRENCLKLKNQLEEIRIGLNQSAGAESLEILRHYPALETLDKPLFRLNAEYREVDMEKIVRDGFRFEVDWVSVGRENDLMRVLDCEAGVVLSIDCTGLRTVRRDAIRDYHPAYQPTICILPRGEFLLTGGGVKNQGSLIGALETVNVITESLEVTLLPVMHSQRMGHSSICVNGTAYVMGGWPNNYLCERFAFSSQTWQQISNLKQGRAYSGICEFEGKIYIAGGHEVDSIEMYIPSQDLFMPLGIRLPAAGRCGLVSVLDGIIAIHGDNISKFHPLKSMSVRERGVTWRTDTWPQHPILPSKDGVVVFISGRIWRYRLEDKDLEAVSDTLKP